MDITSLAMKDQISLSQLCTWEKWYCLRSLAFLKQARSLLLPAWGQQRDHADEILILFVINLSWWHPKGSITCTSVRIYRPTALNCCECSIAMSGKAQEWGGMAFQPNLTSAVSAVAMLHLPLPENSPQFWLRSVNAAVQHGKPWLATSLCTLWPHHCRSQSWHTTPDSKTCKPQQHRPHTAQGLAYLQLFWNVTVEKKPVHWTTWKKKINYILCVIIAFFWCESQLVEFKITQLI